MNDVSQWRYTKNGRKFWMDCFGSEVMIKKKTVVFLKGFNHYMLPSSQEEKNLYLIS